MNYYYDEDFECFSCAIALDEDEMQKFVSGSFRECPYFRRGDEYSVVRKQM